MTKEYKVYGWRPDEAFTWNFSKENNARIIECGEWNDDYSIIKITRNTETECDSEMFGQETDGLLENEHFEKIEGYGYAFMKELGWVM